MALQHGMAEEVPDDLAGALGRFFADGGLPFSAHPQHPGRSPA
jgi:hypothetical protein